MKKVDFLIIGVQKAGTTSTAEVLSRHPQLFVLPEEGHFFDRIEGEHLTMNDLEKYHKRFQESSRFKKDAMWGEKTPFYCYDPKALSLIYEYNPRMKLVMILRDPVERAFSQWKMYQWSNDFMDHPWRGVSFEECIYREVNAPPKVDREEKDVVNRGFYFDQVLQVLQLFPQEQVLFCEAESLKRFPFEEYNRIFEFLNVETQEQIFVNYNLRKSPTDPKASFLVEYHDDYDKIYSSSQEKLKNLFRSHNIFTRYHDEKEKRAEEALQRILENAI